MNIGNVNPAHMEKALADKLQELLSSVPEIGGFQIEKTPRAKLKPYDFRVDLKLLGNVRVSLFVECKAEPRPSLFNVHVNVHRDFHPDHRLKRAEAYVLAAPYISPRMGQVCREHGWSWYDLAGNCWISIPGVIYIERSGNQPVIKKPKPSANLSSPETARIIRALLVPENADLRWTQHSIQMECQPNVSIGLVNKVIRYLREQSFIAELEEGGFRLKDPLGLLKTWREAYDFSQYLRRNYFTLKHGPELKKALASLGSLTGGRAVYAAAFSAAEIQAPHVRQAKTWLFLSAEWEEKFRDILEAKLVDSGENLVVLIPRDNGVFYMQDGGIVGELRLPRTNLIQTYIDLCHCGSRGEEAANALLEQRIKPEWKLKMKGLL